MLSAFDIKRFLRQVTLLGLRSANIVSKFALALYTARYLGLADLGAYGLVVGAATCAPALLGLGLTAWIMRKLVNLPRAEAIPYMLTRLGLTTILQVVAQAIGWTINARLGWPIPSEIAWPVAAIMMLEATAGETFSMLTARRRVLLAEITLFIRSGLWPIPVVIYGLVVPQARTLETILLGWIGGLIITWVVLVVQLIPGERWRYLHWHWQGLLQGARESVPLYIHDMSQAISLYLDRFLISLFIGLELTGVYTFFWSVANVVHALTIYGVLTPQIATLVDAGARGHGPEFEKVERRLQIESAAWAIVFALAGLVAVPYLLPFLERPLLYQYLPVFWIAMAATLFRLASDGYGYVLYALRRDRMVAGTTIAGTIGSAALNSLLVPFAGISGAAIAFLIVSATLFAVRFTLSRAPAETAIHSSETTRS